MSSIHKDILGDLNADNITPELPHRSPKKEGDKAELEKEDDEVEEDDKLEEEDDKVEEEDDKAMFDDAGDLEILFGAIGPRKEYNEKDLSAMIQRRLNAMIERSLISKTNNASLHRQRHRHRRGFLDQYRDQHQKRVQQRSHREEYLQCLQQLDLRMQMKKKQYQAEQELEKLHLGNKQLHPL